MPDQTTSPWADFPIYVQDTGKGDPVLLLHSSGMSGDQWKRAAEMVVDGGRRALIPDFIGHGRSTPLPVTSAFRFEDDVALIVRLLARIDAPIHVVGHSYGGLVALKAALLAPARVRSLALYDPVAFGVLDPAGDRDQAAEADLTRIRFGYGESPSEHEAWLRTFVDYWSGDGAWASLREPARAEFSRVGWVAHEGARTLVSDRTPAEAYAGLTVPALLMTGETTPAAAARVVAKLGASLPNARVERIAGAGHMGPLTHGKQVNALVAAHLDAAK